MPQMVGFCMASMVWVVNRHVVNPPSWRIWGVFLRFTTFFWRSKVPQISYTYCNLHIVFQLYTYIYIYPLETKSTLDKKTLVKIMKKWLLTFNCVFCVFRLVCFQRYVWCLVYVFRIFFMYVCVCVHVWCAFFCDVQLLRTTGKTSQEHNMLYLRLELFVAYPLAVPLQTKYIIFESTMLLRGHCYSFWSRPKLYIP